MSKLKIQMAKVSQDDIREANEKAGGGFSRYNGPTPPPGNYNLKFGNMFFKKTANGKDMLTTFFSIQDEDYKGAEVSHNQMIPDDPAYQHYHIQVSSMDRFLRGLSGGKIGIAEFAEAVTKGQIHAEEPNKAGMQKITQIGSLKTDKIGVVAGKVKHHEYNGNTFLQVHYLADPPKQAASKSDDFDDSSSDNDDFSLDDDDLDFGGE